MKTKKIVRIILLMLIILSILATMFPNNVLADTNNGLKSVEDENGQNMGDKVPFTEEKQIELLSEVTVSKNPTTGDVINGANNFLNASGSALGTEQIKQQTSFIYNTLVGVGIVIVVIVAAALGLKFIMGSVEEQAKVKQTLIPFIIGCIIIFGAFGIWRVVLLLADGIDNTDQTSKIEITINEEVQLGKAQ